MKKSLVKCVEVVEKYVCCTTQESMFIVNHRKMLLYTEMFVCSKTQKYVHCETKMLNTNTQKMFIVKHKQSMLLNRIFFFFF